MSDDAIAGLYVMGVLFAVMLVLFVIDAWMNRLELEEENRQLQEELKNLTKEESDE